MRNRCARARGGTQTVRCRQRAAVFSASGGSPSGGNQRDLHFPWESKLSNQSSGIIYLVATPARASFRRTGGDVSRHLHTLWVAIETLVHNAEVRPADLHLGWTKPQLAIEWSDTRDFAAKAAMTSVVDALDQYLKVLARIPRLTNPNLEDTLKGTARTPSGARLTIFARFAVVVAQYGCAVAPEQLAVIELLATWRNRFVHGDYRHSLSKHARRTLEGATGYFGTAQGGANIGAMLQRFDGRKAPSLKDLVTLITSCQLAVGVLDEHLIHLQSPQDFVLALVEFALRQAPDPPALLERVFAKGGRQSAGAALALLHSFGVAKTQGYTGSAPSIKRGSFDAVVGMGRNAASTTFGIERP